MLQINVKAKWQEQSVLVEVIPLIDSLFLSLTPLDLFPIVPSGSALQIG